MPLTRRLARHGLVLLSAFTLVTLGIAAARACSTPVYRVAMYDWTSAPYHVFYFYRDKVADEDAKVHEKITAAAKDEKSPANAIVHLVDVAKKESLDELPLVVLEAWQKEAKEKAPLHVIYSAWGAKLWEGRLTDDEVAGLLDSPKRKRIAELLDAGNAAVMLVLAAPKEEKTKHAEKVIAKVIADAAAGKIDAGALPDVPAAKPSGKAADDKPADKKDKEPVLKIATLTVSRTDPAEKWLVRSLVAVEPDLEEYAEEAMIFPVYGRARALPPFIGKGINQQNLSDAVFFVSGACSCTIKEQNPGMDLLVRWNWDETAQKLAANDPTLQWDGDQFGYQEIEPGPQQVATADDPGDMPEEPAATEPTEAESPAEPAEEKAPAGEKAAETPAPSDPPEDQPTAGAGHSAENAATSAQPAAAPAGEANAAEPSASHREADQYATRQVWRLGIGVGLGTVVLLLAGLVLMRRQ